MALGYFVQWKTVYASQFSESQTKSNKFENTKRRRDLLINQHVNYEYHQTGGSVKQVTEIMRRSKIRNSDPD